MPNNLTEQRLRLLRKKRKLRRLRLYHELFNQINGQSIEDIDINNDDDVNINTGGGYLVVLGENVVLAGTSTSIYINEPSDSYKTGVIDPCTFTTNPPTDLAKNGLLRYKDEIGFYFALSPLISGGGKQRDAALYVLQQMGDKIIAIDINADPGKRPADTDPDPNQMFLDLVKDPNSGGDSQILPINGESNSCAVAGSILVPTKIVEQPPSLFPEWIGWYTNSKAVTIPIADEISFPAQIDKKGILVDERVCYNGDLCARDSEDVVRVLEPRGLLGRKNVSTYDLDNSLKWEDGLRQDKKRGWHFTFKGGAIYSVLTAPIK